MSDEHPDLTDDELEAQQSELLPDRELLSLLPNLGGTSGAFSDPLGLAGTSATSPGPGGSALPGVGGVPGTGTTPDTSGITGTGTSLLSHAANTAGQAPYSPTETSSAS